MPTARGATFELVGVTTEYRYKPAYLIYDKAGHVWRHIETVVSSMTGPLAVSPNQTIFVAEEGRYKLCLEIAKCFVGDARPLTNFDEEDVRVATEFFAVVLRELDISRLERVGTRVQMFASMPDEAASFEFVRSLGLVAVPREPRLGITPKKIKPTWVLEVEDEKEDLAYTARVHSLTREESVDPPPEARHLEKQTFKEHGVLADFDFYTTKAVDVAGFKLTAWLNKWRRALYRDFEAVLDCGRAKS